MIPIRRAYSYYRREGLGSLLNAGIRVYVVPNIGKLGRTGSIIFLVLHWLIPFIGKVYVKRTDGTWIVKRAFRDESYAFPSFPSPAQFHNVVRGYPDAMVQKYTSNEFLQVEEDDTVVDVGAFIGAFSLGIAATANSVYSIEPSRENIQCLERNTQSVSNIEAVRGLAWNEDTEMSLKLGVDPTDHSTLNIDGKDSGEEEVVEAYRMKSLMDELDIEVVDFLKIDAEGAEPEVITGCTDASIRKIAVDCGAERFGHSSADEVKELLIEAGYDVGQTYQVVYGWRDSEDANL